MSFSRSHLNLACAAVILAVAQFVFCTISQADPDKQIRTDLEKEDLVRVLAVTKPTDNFTRAEKFEAMQGGAGTSQKIVNRHAFSHFSQNISFAETSRFHLGDAFFRKLWVSSPSSTFASDGLGPLFNARSCQSCHLKDGRGHPPYKGEQAASMFLRLARPAETAEEKNKIENLKAINYPDPVYGGQLQTFSVAGIKPEGRMVISYKEEAVTLKGGEKVSLRKPEYGVADLAYGPLHKKITLSPRIANPMIRLGLVEAIPAADIIKLADPDDKDKDGISGKAALVRDQKGKVSLGRFGWKAQNPNIRMQSAGAFAGDIGISTPDVPRHTGDCTKAQKECFALPNGVQKNLGTTEAPDPVMDLVTFYASNLAVPERRDVNKPEVLRGKKLFYQTGCVSCHRPKFVTSKEANIKAHRFQLIWPYSDFLLHDMGEGLADGQQVGLASGREWRTPPLWGIGLTKTVSGHTFFLHDGRARNLTEAILWHGGEAKKSRDAFANLKKESRDDLIKFLESL